MNDKRVIELPAPGYPLVTRMITDGMAGGAPEVWVIRGDNPAASGFKIVRMFQTRTNVEIYSIAGDQCVRHTVPLTRTHIIEEAMPLDMFIEELRAAEEGGGDDDEDDDDGPDLEAPDEPDAPQPSGATADGSS